MLAPERHMTAPQRPRRQPAGDSKSPSPPRRALVAETDPAALRTCSAALAASGFAVDAVDTGIDAVIAARRHRPDVILVDLQLRDVPGREAVDWLRSNPALAATPIILLVTSAAEDAKTNGIHPTAVLRKPLSPIAIRRAIGALFGTGLEDPTDESR
jgi:two-component system, cell cycle response regulator DivK